MGGGTRTGRLVTGSEGLLYLSLGRWAEEKLGYLKKYCDIFSTAMRRKWVRRVYIDLFCGPGKICVKNTPKEIEGSPLVAFHYEFTDYFFNDKEPAAIESLKERIKRLGPRPGTNYSFFQGDCNEAVESIVHQLPPSALYFCFVDPFGWEIHFSAIERLAKSRRLDLVITFHTGNMKRAAHLAPHELDLFFGDQAWKTHYEEARYPGRALLDFYKKRLKGLGYSYLREDLGFRNSRGVLLYHLLFASKHPRGEHLWNEISQRSPSGQLRMPLRETGIKYSP